MKIISRIATALCICVYSVSCAQELSYVQHHGIHRDGAPAFSRLILDNSVRKGLEFSVDQTQRLEAILLKLKKDQREAEQLLKAGQVETFREQLDASRRRFDKDFEALLLPHQVSWVKQQSLSRYLAATSGFQLLLHPFIKNELALSDKQLDLLRRTHEKLEKEVEQQIAQARAQAHEELKAVLGKYSLGFPNSTQSSTEHKK